MTKRIAIVASLVLAMGLLAACGGSNTQAASSAPASSAAVSSAPAASSEPAAASSEPAASSAAASSAAASSEALPTSSEIEQGLKTIEAALTAVDKYWSNFPTEGNNQLPAEEIFKKMDAGEDFYILDIRSADDYAQGHLKGAVNIPYGKIGENLEAIPDDKPIWINCYTGQTSSQTTVLLSMVGKDAHNIQSGWLRGITQTEGYENYVDTTENTFPEGTYAVDPELKTMIEAYYKGATDEAQPHPNYNFDVDELAKLVEAGDKSYTILDVRQAKDYDEGHIAGAINIPFGKDMHNELLLLDGDKPIIVNCYTGQTASQVVATLWMMGFEAYNLNGGMGKEGAFGWLENGNPVVSTADEGKAAA